MKLGKSVITGALAALMVVGSVGAAFAADARVTTTLNVRHGPGPSYHVIDVLDRGTRVEIEECNRRGTWCYVTARYAEGWVSTNYLRPLRDDRPDRPDRPRRHDRDDRYYDDYDYYEDSYGNDFYLQWSFGYVD